MKELNEYKAEILRRSRERIGKKKRTRKLMLSVCVPFCLVLVISSVIVLPTLIAREDVMIADDLMGDADGATADIREQYYLYADILCGGDSVRIEDAELIDELSELIRLAYKDSYLWYDITERAEMSKDDAGDEDNYETYNAEDECESEDQIESYTVTVTLTAPDGYVKTIIIEGNTIRDPELDMEVTLNEERLEELKALLTVD